MSQRSIFSSEEEDDGDSTLSSDEELSIYTYGEKQTRDAEEFKGEQRETSGFGLPLMRNLFAKIVPAEKMIQAKERAEVHPEGHIPESKAPCVTEKEKLLLNFSKVVDGLLIQNPPPQQPSQPLTEENILASELCSAIEEIFLYGLKSKILSSIFKEKWSEAWRMLQIIFEMSKDPFLGESISLVDSIADQRSADRLRLWIKNGLNSGMITHFAQLIMLEREIVKEFYDASSIFRGRVDEWENFLLGLSSISHLKFSFALSPLLNKSSSFDEIASSCVNTENTSNIAYPELISNNEESASSVNHAKSSVRRFSLMSNKYSSESMNDEEKSVEYFESRMQDLAMTIGENSDLSLCGDSGLSDIFGVHKTCSSLDDLNHLINDFSDSKPVIGSAKEEIESHKDVVFPSDPLPRVQSENMQTESEAKAPANIESLTLKKDSAVISDISSDSIPILFKNIDTCNSSLNSNVYSGDHIELNLKRVPKTPDPNLLQNQNEKCASCGNAIGRTLWINFCRYCTYIGKLYCMKCHRNEFSIIPGLLINDLDIREYPVCVLAKRFLSSMNSFPVIPLSSIRKNFPDEPVLEEMQNLRRRISLMWGYIRDCKKATRITRILGDRSYLLINDDMFSIKDIARFLSKDGSTLIKAIADSLGQHILSDCAHCTSKGSTCLYCQSPDLIYSFQSESAVQCRRCMGVYHRSCFNRLNCPTCKSNIPNKS